MGRYAIEAMVVSFCALYSGPDLPDAGDCWKLNRELALSANYGR